MAKYGGRPAATRKLGIRVVRAGSAVDQLLEGYSTLSSPTEKRASKFLAALREGAVVDAFQHLEQVHAFECEFEEIKLV